MQPPQLKMDINKRLKAWTIMQRTVKVNFRDSDSHSNCAFPILRKPSLKNGAMRSWEIMWCLK